MPVESSAIRRSLLAFIVAGCGGAVAGTNTWTSAGLQGGTVYDLAFHPTTPSILYASAANGFYRSTDSGATWQQTPTPTSYYLRPSVLAVTASSRARMTVPSGAATGV